MKENNVSESSQRKATNCGAWNEPYNRRSCFLCHLFSVYLALWLM